MIESIYQWFRYIGLSPHKPLPMTGVRNPIYSASKKRRSFFALLFGVSDVKCSVRNIIL